MYCPVCGAESTQGLNFCKRCGSSLSDAVQASPAPPARNIVAGLILAAATVGIVLGGLAIVFTFALALVGPQPPGYTPSVHNSLLVAVMMVTFGSTTIAMVTLMLIKLFSRIMGFGQAGFGQSPGRAPQIPRAFVPEPRLEIQAPSPGVSSVTEHTTRTFNQAAYREHAGRE